MANHGQHQQDSPANDVPSKSGGRQAVVELCEISTGGLVFWSRARFDIGSEVQVRIKRSEIPVPWLDSMLEGEWVTLRGLVVACPPRRREDGSSGFLVSLLLEKETVEVAAPVPVRSRMRWSRSVVSGMKRYGLN